MSAEYSRPPSPSSRPESPHLFPMNSFSLDRLVPEDGLEFADAFTLLGQPHLNLMAFMLDLTLQTLWRRTGMRGWTCCSATSQGARTDSRCAQSSPLMRFSKGNLQAPKSSPRISSARSPG